MENVNLIFFSRVPKIQLDRSRVVQGLYEDYLSYHIFFGFEYLLKGWVVANHKLSKCSASNGNPYKPQLEIC